jgi:hypothetical protein
MLKGGRYDAKSDRPSCLAEMQRVQKQRLIERLTNQPAKFQISRSLSVVGECGHGDVVLVGAGGKEERLASLLCCPAEVENDTENVVELIRF